MGDLRAINTQYLDAYQLKSMDTVIDSGESTTSPLSGKLLMVPGIVSISDWCCGADGSVDSVSRLMNSALKMMNSADLARFGPFYKRADGKIALGE